MPSIQSTLVWETVGIPLVSGVDLNTRARLVDKVKLLKAENVFFPRTGGPETRRGHQSLVVQDSAVPNTEYTDVVGTAAAGDNMYGFGLINRPSNPGFSTVYTQRNDLSIYPFSGEILGLASRDNEVLSWDGHRLFSYHTGTGHTTRVQGTNKYSDGTTVSTRACMPTAKTSVIGKTSYAQTMSDVADNGVTRVMVTKNTSTNVPTVFVYDSVNGSLKFSQTIDVSGTYGMNSVESVKVINVGEWFHVYVADGSVPLAAVYTLHQSSLAFVYTASLGDCNGYFDIAKVNENLVLIAKTTAANAVNITYLNGPGQVDTSYSTQNRLLSIGGFAAFYCGVATDGKYIALIFRDTAAARTRYAAYTMSGGIIGAAGTLSTNANTKHVTVCASAVGQSKTSSVFFLFEDEVPGAGASFVTSTPLLVTDTSRLALTGNTKYNVQLASKAFTVGAFGFVYTCYNTTLQTQYLLMDNRLMLAGRLEYGSAISSTADSWLPTVNFVFNSTKWMTYNFHCALMYRLRILTQSTNPASPTTTGVFQEQSTKLVEMNFQPKLVSAQMGRSTYFAGALLWMYDGRELNEANFIAGPEGYTFTSSNAGGSMVPGNKYRYRVYLCHKNAQGEEVRSPAFLSDEFTVGVGHNRVIISGKTVPTNKPDSYFLVYRNENIGTLWYLVSDRDPSSANCPKNDQTTGTWTYTDTLADASIIARELDPANNLNWLQPWAAPSCEVVSFGKDRLWIAGGEIDPGEVWVSRLANGKEVPGFSPVLATSLDKESSPITAIGFLADFTAVFKRNATYIITGSFSGNNFAGNNVNTQLAISEVGATSPYVSRVTSGLLFQSTGGYKMLGAGANLENVGADVSSITGTLVGIVTSFEDRNVRFYQSDADSPVLDYESGEWSTFTLSPNAAVANPVTGYAVLAMGNRLWFETEDLYTDDGAVYWSVVRTAWLGANPLGGFQRVRRIGALGEYTNRGTLKVNVYYDEREYPDESFTWSNSSGLANGTWGEGVWGQAFWGDRRSDGQFRMRDSVWRFRYRLAKQKCSVISIEMRFKSDRGAFAVPTVVMLELGKKEGMDRMPARNFS